VLFTKQSFILACTENNNNIQNTIFYGWNTMFIPQDVKKNL
jgi:hypothetical protein